MIPNLTILKFNLYPGWARQVVWHGAGVTGI